VQTRWPKNKRIAVATNRGGTEGREWEVAESRGVRLKDVSLFSARSTSEMVFAEGSSRRLGYEASGRKPET
jgi:hypothetical protein